MRPPIAGKSQAAAVPFQNIEAEKAALGAMLMDSRTIGDAMRALHPSHFYYRRHGAIYIALARQYRAAQLRPADVDLITTCGALTAAGVLAEIGGAAYLTALIGVCPNAANIGAYVSAIIEAAQYRALHKCSEVLREAVCEQAGVKRDADWQMVPEPMYQPARISAALRKFADGIDAMGEVKPAPDLKLILEESK